jgi:dCMP deaminase
MERIERGAMLMTMAFLSAKRSTCNRKQVGCVISKEGRVLTLGYAGSPSGTPHCTDEGCILDINGGCIRTQHAEANAIAFSAKHGIALDGSTLHTTLSPCLACAKIIINAGIKEVVYNELYRDDSPIGMLLEARVKVLQGYPYDSSVLRET